MLDGFLAMTFSVGWLTCRQEKSGEKRYVHNESTKRLFSYP